MQTARPNRHLARRLAVTVVPLLAVTACGSDGTDGAAASADANPFCSAVVAGDALDSPGGPTEPTAEEITAFGTALRPIVDDLVAGAPSAAKDAVTRIDQAVGSLEQGDGSAFQDPAVNEAIETMEQVGRSECGFTSVDVTAANYSFAGVPTEIAAGPASFHVTNQGTEPHVLLFVRKPADVTDDVAFVQDYLGAVFSGDPSKLAAFASSDVPGGGAGADPGGVATHVTEFSSGTYIYFCPIPVGLVDGAPMHFTKGMIGEFTVG